MNASTKSTNTYSGKGKSLARTSLTHLLKESCLPTDFKVLRSKGNGCESNVPHQLFSLPICFGSKVSRILSYTPMVDSDTGICVFTTMILQICMLAGKLYLLSKYVKASQSLKDDLIQYTHWTYE